MAQFSWIVLFCVVSAVSNGIFAGKHYLLYKSELKQISSPGENGVPVFETDLKKKLSTDSFILSTGLPFFPKDVHATTETKEEIFESLEHIKLRRWAKLYHMKFNVHVMFHITESREESNAYLPDILKALVKKYGDDAEKLRCITYEGRDASEHVDLMEQIDEIGELYGFRPLKETDVVLLGKEYLWIGNRLENLTNAKYLMDTSWIPEFNEDNDMLDDKWPEKGEKERPVKQTWLVTAMLDPVQFFYFSSHIFGTYVRQLGELEKLGIRVILLITSTRRKTIARNRDSNASNNLSTASAILANIQEKFQKRGKKFYYASTFHWGQTGATGDTDAQKFSTFTKFFNGLFHGLIRGPQSIPLNRACPALAEEEKEPETFPIPIVYRLEDSEAI